MKRITIKFLIVIPLLILLTGCPDDADNNFSLWLNNQSGEDLFYIIKLQSENGACPDEKLPVKKNGTILKKYQSNTRYFTPTKCDSMYVIILNLGTVNKYEWSEIREKDMVLKQYHIAQGDGKITYP